MRNVLRAMSLLFSLSVLIGLTYRAGGGCRATSDRSVSPQAAADSAQQAPIPKTDPALPKADPSPNPPPANPVIVPPDRFLGASKAAPVFLTSEVTKPAPAQAPQAPQAAQRK